MSEIADRLHAFLAARMPGAANLAIYGLVPLTGGNARRAWSFDVSWTEASAARHVPCVMLSQAEAGQLESDLGAEFAVLSSLNGTDVPHPRALWLDADGTWLGAPSFIMERLPGTAEIVPLLRPENPDSSRALAVALAGAAARLHAVDWRGRGLDRLGDPAPAEVAHQQVAHWKDLFLRHRMEPMPAMAHAFRWLEDHAPVAERIVLVHGDLRFGNFLYRDTELVGLLDWEMAHPGDPAEDLAWVYHPLWSAEPFLPIADFVAAYTAAGGAPIPAQSLHFYRQFALIKHSVISLTGARSFRDGRTRNLRMADRMTLAIDCLIQFFDAMDESAARAAA